MKMSSELLIFKMVKLYTIIAVLFLISSSRGMMSGDPFNAGYQAPATNFYIPNESSIELTISGFNLCDDPNNPVSPVVAIYEKESNTEKYNVNPSFVTEVIENECNPIFTQTYTAGYIFETIQTIRFKIYDGVVSKRTLIRLSKEGFSIASILQKSDQGVIVELMKAGENKDYSTIPGVLHITAEDIENIHDTITIVFSGYFTMGDRLIDPHLIVSKTSDQSVGVFRAVIGTQPSYALRWRVDIEIRKFCNRNLHRLIKLAIWEKGMLYETASVITKLRDLMNPNNTFALEPEGFGFLEVDYLEINKVKTYSFTSYIEDGLEIQCSIVIDFTGSNGNPSVPGTLHYKLGREPNDYEAAILEVVPIILQLDSDKKIPVYGFGAANLPNKENHMAFAVNFKPNKPECDGIEGVRDAYRNCLNVIHLHGPTHFQPSIKRQVEFIKQQLEIKKANPQYFILLMLTDGIIGDLDETKTEIIKAVNLPLSIIIVGMGNYNFNEMEILDGDGDKVLTNRAGLKATRDIVQFVPFNIKRNELNLAVLAEVPNQFSSYAKSEGYAPRPRPGRYPSGVIISRPPSGPNENDVRIPGWNFGGMGWIGPQFRDPGHL